MVTVHNTLIFLGLMLMIAVGCDGESERKDSKGGADPLPTSSAPDDQSKNQLPTTQGSDAVSKSTATNGQALSMQQCNNQGLSWIAAPNSGIPACGGPLLQWGCCKEQILARYPNVAGELGPQIDDLVLNQQFQLYNCSMENNRPTFHFVKWQGSQTFYQTRSTDAPAFEPAAGSVPECPQVPSISGPLGNTGNNAVNNDQVLDDQLPPDNQSTIDDSSTISSSEPIANSNSNFGN